MDAAKILLCYTTVKSLSVAKELAQQAVQDKVAGCVNIIPGIMSVFPWKNGVQTSTECIILFKLTIEMKDHFSQWLEKSHPYELPAKLFWTSDTSGEFLEYIQSGLSA